MYTIDALLESLRTPLKQSPKQNQEEAATTGEADGPEPAVRSTRSPQDTPDKSSDKEELKLHD